MLFYARVQFLSVKSKKFHDNVSIQVSNDMKVRRPYCFNFNIPLNVKKVSLY